MPTDRVRKRVLVAGATGRLGQLVKVLFARGHMLRATTRDPGSSAAARLRCSGAQIVSGDFDDPTAIERAAAGVDAVFASGAAQRAGPEGGLRHGRDLAVAAAAARVGRRADPRTSGRLHHPRARLLHGEPVQPLEPDCCVQGRRVPQPDLDRGPLQQVAIADVAAVAAIAIERPEEFAGRRIAIASDRLTAVRGAEALSRTIRRDLDPEQLPTADLGPGLQALFGWLERAGHDADSPALHAGYPEVRRDTYEAQLRSQRARLSTLCPRDHAVAR